MEKRIFLAILISIAFLWLWAAIAPKLFPDLVKKPQPAKPAVTAPARGEQPVLPPAATGTGTPATSTAAPQPATTSTTAVAATAPVGASAVQRSVIETPDYIAVFTNRGAELISFRLKKYHHKQSLVLVELVKAREASRTDFPFFVESSDEALAKKLNSALYAVTEHRDAKEHVIQYRYSDGRVTATKTFKFQFAQPFLFDFAVSVTPAAPYRVVIGPGIRTLGPEEQDSRIVMTGNGVLARDGKFRVINREKGNVLQVYDAVQYIGLEDNYFMSVLRPTRGGDGVLRRMAFFNSKKERRDDLYASVNAGRDGVVAGDAFFGPKETKLLDRYGMGDALQFGWFGLIGRFFLKALVWINQTTKNYGFAIIVLTILIKIVLYPLQHKQNVSMKKMQRAQPKIEALKAKYKKAKTDAEQRNKMNMEMMQLYQKEGINPMAGCLPLVLQLPILWGFYGLLSRAIELRGAPFILWIHDLSDKDPYYITPILMTATMFLQTYLMPATGDPAQRKMFLIMPLVFGFLFKDFPSGLVLYWLVQNILTIAQQLIMNKWWKEHPMDVQNA